MLPLAPLFVKVRVADRRTLAMGCCFPTTEAMAGGCYFVKIAENIGISKSRFLAEGSADENVQ
jgi:hypothetical protein